jgi:hypothetical protein
MQQRHFKLRQAMPAPELTDPSPKPRPQGTKQMALQIWHQDGVRGYYRGFGTVVFGTMPARVVRAPGAQALAGGLHPAAAAARRRRPVLGGPMPAAALPGGAAGLPAGAPRACLSR